jgi:hypothetical protein
MKTLLMGSATKIEHWVKLIQDKSCLCTHMIFWQKAESNQNLLCQYPENGRNWVEDRRAHSNVDDDQ